MRGRVFLPSSVPLLLLTLAIRAGAAFDRPHPPRPPLAAGPDGAVRTADMTGKPPAPSGVEPGVEPLVRKATEDLARRLSIPAERIAVLEARFVVWPDKSLGCPQPGMRYLQVPQDGVLIRLGADGRSYAYHGGGGREPFLCERTVRPPASAPPKLDGFAPRRDRDTD